MSNVDTMNNVEAYFVLVNKMIDISKSKIKIKANIKAAKKIKTVLETITI